MPDLLNVGLMARLGGLIDEFGSRPIALYGGGRFTERLLERLTPGHDMPPVLCIIDDNPTRNHIRGVAVLDPELIDPSLVAGILVSSDAHPDIVSKRAHAWARRAPLDQRPVVLELDSSISIAPENDQQTHAEPHPCAPAGTVPALLDTDGIDQHRCDTYTVREDRSIARRVVRVPRHQSMPGSPFRRHDRLDVSEYATASRRGMVTDETPISVLGSCFAQRLREWLIANGYNYCQWEHGPAVYGSINAGAIYNSGSLRQTFQWAFEGFDAAEPFWHLAQELADPYRKFLVWPDRMCAERERDAHFDAVRRLVMGSGVLIVTLGMSEVWRNRQDGACFAWLPPREVINESRHEFAVLDAATNDANLETFYRIVRANNPDLQLILTLSPIPIVLTHLNRHIVVSDTASKASLRAAIDSFCARHPEVEYFPSYEMVARSPRWAYDHDNWHVSDPGVISQIMRAFVRCYGPGSDDPCEARTEPSDS